MPDPMSITAGGISLISLLIQTAANLHDLIEQSRDAPMEMIELRNELAGLSITLGPLEEIREWRNFDRAYSDSLNRLLTSIQKDLDKINRLGVTKALKKSETRPWGKLKDLHEKELQMLRASLSAHTASLSLIVKLPFPIVYLLLKLTLRSVQSRSIVEGRLFANVERKLDKMYRQLTIGTVIAVMGETGSGKSHFIQQIVGPDIDITEHSLHSGTQSVQAYSLTIESQVLTLIDTPGFDDSRRTDAEILEQVGSWLASAYKSQEFLSGIIYLHPITSTRMRGSAVRSLEVFSKLVGPDSFYKIALVTSMWDLLQDQDVGASREHQLREEFWKDLIEKGSVTARSHNNRESALAILKRVAFGQSMGREPEVPLAIQKEMVEEQRPLENTSAYEALTRRMDEMESRHHDELERVEQRHQENQSRMEAEIENLRAKRAEPRQEKSAPIPPSTVPQQGPSANIYVHIAAKELLEMEPPPPYSSLEPWWRGSSIFNRLSELTLFTLTPAFELLNLLKPRLKRLMRPSRALGTSRIEWGCTCGETLYGDYVEKTPGSLRQLADRLGGLIVSGPALRSVATSQPTSGGSERDSARSQESQPTNSSSRGSRRPPQLGAPTTSPADSALVSHRTAMNEVVAAPRWLELCIRAGSDTFVLGEIDVAGRQTDQAVFRKIREKYTSNRDVPRLLGRFAFRTVTGGIFVQFRKDKLASRRTGKPATASIMNSPSVPLPHEAKTYRYIFDPIPMDEPPIDARTFNHYFHKIHQADEDDTWITRFPQLQDSSLFYGNEKLAKGWGIEIIEAPNWMLFLIVNLWGLLFSGAVAALTCILMHDNQTGVAIGAWLSAVQMLTITALFWQWTSR